MDQKSAAVDKGKDSNDDIANDIDHKEESQLQEVAEREPLPTSKAGFKKHPLGSTTRGQEPRLWNWTTVDNGGSKESRLGQIQQASEPLDKDKFEYLYGSWQTDKWSPPPVGPGDLIPVSEHSNIELELLNPGLVHGEVHRVAKVAKKLGLDYAPCLLGFEGSGKPAIRGIVVHVTNEVLLREAHAAIEEHSMQEENTKCEKTILLRWK